MARLMYRVKTFVRGEEAATMVEYGLMVALIAIVCIAAVTLLGVNLQTVFNAIAAALVPVVPAAP